MPAPKLLSLIKETAYNDLTAVTAANAIRAEDVSYTPRGDRENPNVAMPGVGAVAGQTTGSYGEISFKVPLITSGVAGTAPKWGYLMKMCGFTETIVATTSVTYARAFNPSAADSGALTWREGRRLHRLGGSRGRFGGIFEENKRPMGLFTLKGIMVDVTDGAQLAQADATWTGWTDQLPIAQPRTTFTFAGAGPPLRSLSFDPVDNVVFSDRPGQKSVDLVGEAGFTGKLKMGVLLPSVLNLETLARTDAISTFSLVHGSTAGNILTVNGRVQSGMPSYSDDKGLDVADVDLGFVPSTLGTDDELSIVLT